jgi:hypothetical protein
MNPARVETLAIIETTSAIPVHVYKYPYTGTCSLRRHPVLALVFKRVPMTGETCNGSWLWLAQVTGCSPRTFSPPRVPYQGGIDGQEIKMQIGHPLSITQAGHNEENEKREEECDEQE